jgi:hypothetical protein
MHFESSYAVRGGLAAKSRPSHRFTILNVHFDFATFGCEHQNAKRSRGSPVGLPRKAVQYTNLGSFSGMLDGSAGHRTHH